MRTDSSRKWRTAIAAEKRKIGSLGNFPRKQTETYRIQGEVLAERRHYALLSAENDVCSGVASGHLSLRCLLKMSYSFGQSALYRVSKGHWWWSPLSATLITLPIIFIRAVEMGITKNTRKPRPKGPFAKYGNGPGCPGASLETLKPFCNLETCLINFL